MLGDLPGAIRNTKINRTQLLWCLVKWLKIPPTSGDGFCPSSNQAGHVTYSDE